MKPNPKLDQSVRHPVDMSPEAVADRLRRCAEISELCIKLKAAGESSLPVDTIYAFPKNADVHGR